MEKTEYIDQGREFKALTGIRGIAASAVVFLHFYDEWVLLFPGLSMVEYSIHKASTAVDFFFLLSGFILCYTQQLRGPGLGWRKYREFLILRIARVYPNHFAALTLLVGFVLAAKIAGLKIEGDYSWGGLPFHYTMTQAFPFIDAGKWNYPTWSVSAEWFAYLFIFPLAWWLIQRRISSIVCLIGGVLLLGAMQGAIACLGTNSLQLTVRVSCGFMAGALFYKVYQQRHPVVQWVQGQGVFWFVMVAAAALLPLGWLLGSSLIIVGCFPWVLLGLTGLRSLPARFLATGPMMWLGRVSYALYISHAISEKVLKIALNPGKFAASSLPVRSLVLAANLGIILAGACLLYYLVEVPGRNLIRKLTAGKSRKPSASPA